MASPIGAFSFPVIAFTETPSGANDMRFQRGFTLIELVTVVAIVAILAAIALPMFTEQVRKGRRAEALQNLSDLQLREERWRANHATYTTTLSDLGASASIPSGFYTFSAATPASAGGCTCSTATCYEFTATAAGAQANDAKCATIVLTNRCGVTAKTSTGGGECWR